MIFNYLRPRYPQLIYPIASATSPLADLFAKHVTVEGLIARMCEKQGKPPPSKVTVDGKGDSEKLMSPDPFEACIPESPITQIINYQNTLSVQAGGIGALEIGAGAANLGLNIASAVLGL